MRYATQFSVQLTLSLAIACLGGNPVLVHADWSDNFDGGLQQTWQFGNLEGSTTFTAGSVDDQLVLTDPIKPEEGGAVTAFGVVVSPPFSDVRMTGVINPAENKFINDSVMLLLRGDLPNQTLYAAEVNYTDKELIIYRNGGPEGSSNLVTEPIPTLEFTDSVYVEFEAIGGSLRAKVFDVPGGDLRAAAVVVDETFSSGLSGVLVDENEPRLSVLGVWDDLTSEAIVGGDYNDNRVVDAADFTVWRDSLGMPAGSLPNDPNFGEIGDDQYQTWKENFGATASGLVALTATSVAVPEPAGGVLVLCSLIAALAMRKS